MPPPSRNDDPRGKAKYNPLSRILFCWISPLFRLGCRRSLEFDDLYVCPPEAESNELLNRFNKYWSVELERKKKGHVPRLWLTWFKCFWMRIIFQGFVLLSVISSLIVMSELLGSLTDYFVIENPSSVQTRNAYLYAIGLGLVSLYYACGYAFHYHDGLVLGMMTRIMLLSAIYKKVLTLSQTTISRITLGHVTNLASNDVHNFDISFVRPWHYFWIAPLHVLAVTYFLYREVQWVALIFTGLLLTEFIFQIGITYLFTKLRAKATKLTDRRVKVMNEIITGIRIIKMYAWEYAFSNVVKSIRKSEIYLILKYFMVLSISFTYNVMSTTFTMFVIFSVYVSTYDDPLTPRKVFVAFSLITLIRTNFYDLSNAVLRVSADVVSVRRIRNFLVLDELCPEESFLVTKNTLVVSNPLFCAEADAYSKNDDVIVNELNASWSMNSEKLTLSNISFTVNKEKPLLAVFGSVGCGKSTLLQCLLKELPALSGTVIVKGSVGYASQEAWVYSATLRDNILFGLPYDPNRYDTAIESCALNKDIELLPQGDLTLIGERGVTLSGGQKARVNLARAVYRQADVYLLDDPLSAVDTAVSKHLFEKCIRGILSDKVVILVTHQIQYLEQCDAILGLKEGCMAVYGNASEVLEKNSSIVDELLTNANADPRSNFLVRKHSLSNCTGLENTSRFQSDLSEITEENEEFEFQLKSVSPVELPDTELVHEMSVPNEERAHGTVSLKTYAQYFIAGGGYFFTILVIAIFIFSEFNVVTADWWIADWADCDSETDINRSTCSLSNAQRIGVYGGLVGSLFVLSLLRAVLFFLLVLNAARIVHNRMFSRVLRAPILFFDTNPIGRVLNRFSKDIGFLDDVLPQYFIDFLYFLFRFVFAMLTASIAIPYMLAIAGVVVTASLILRWYYLKTARDLKRLEALARSPIYSHLSLTMQGLSTIRAYLMQEDSMKLFHSYQNKHTQASYLFVVANRWIGLRLEFLSLSFICSMSIASVALTSTFNAGLVGLALTYSLALMTTFTFCVRESGEVESLMISAERVMAYGQLETESSLETDPSIEVQSDWPMNGHIELRKLSYRHSSEGPLVLKEISCDIKSREKIGIVGRTGAGKSSLIGALFRLAEPTGSIIIDGIEIHQLGLHDIRSKMSIIPQDPVLFGASVRYNLDPFIQYDDDEIWRALQQVQLKNVVKYSEGGLESTVSEGGGNFSVGQRQLFCLARALLQNNKILILDEATANVDMETDAIIQQVIREEFSDCTILTIAHRLDTVIDSDRIMVLRAGEVIEFDEPHTLLNESSSYLSKLVEQTGPNNAERLRSMALESYIKHQLLAFEN